MKLKIKIIKELSVKARIANEIKKELNIPFSLEAY